jgi:DNA-binding NtrC family response regulator
MRGTILIVDDEATQLRVMESVLTRLGFNIRTASDGKEAINILRQVSGAEITLMILNLAMPPMSGFEVLKTIKALRSELPIIVLTAHSSLATVGEAIEAGANDFICKPASAEKIRTVITSALEREQLVGEIEHISKTLPQAKGFDQLIGNSKAFLDAVRTARKSVRAKTPVLIEGECGVGKELFARAIQNASDRANKPFVTVNCGAIPENLIESILFGHEKGAFTGADKHHVGKFEEAKGGTLFLDEVGELPQDIQVKLLRALQEGEIEPVGSKKSKKIDIRLISATNQNLIEQISQGNFREDLYYRLNAFPLHIPSLRKRQSDIPALTTYFINAYHQSEALGKKHITKEALSLLQNYNWPGNIRQLQNAIFRAIVMCDGDTLTPMEFPQTLALAGLKTRLPTLKHFAPNAAPFDGQMFMLNDDDELRSFQEMEKEIIEYALNHYQWRMSKISRILNIGRSTLYRKVEEYGLRKK